MGYVLIHNPKRALAAHTACVNIADTARSMESLTHKQDELKREIFVFQANVRGNLKRRYYYTKPMSKQYVSACIKWVKDVKRMSGSVRFSNSREQVVTLMNLASAKQ